MDNHKTQNRPELAQGQLWKIDYGYLYIAELGKRLIHYKMLRQPTQSAAILRLIRTEALAMFLKHSDAELVSSPTAPEAASQPMATKASSASQSGMAEVPRAAFAGACA